MTLGKSTSTSDIFGHKDSLKIRNPNASENTYAIKKERCKKVNGRKP